MKNNNKLIITKEEEYIISSMFQARDMVEVDIYPTNEDESILGNIYVGKVKNIIKNINAAFVEITDGKMCYLSLSKNTSPIFSSHNPGKDKIASGDELLVQVSKEQIKTKAPVVTTNINFTGKYVVLVHGSPYIGISSKIKDKNKRNNIKNTLKPYLTDSFGFIARTNSVLAPKERIIDEVNVLIKKYEEIMEYGIYKSRFSMVYETPPGYICDIRDGYDKKLDEIITDDGIIYDKIENYIKEYQAEDHHKLRFYEDGHVSLNNLYGIKSKLNNLLKEKVWLKSGASIIIQHTEALTVIDVNTGKAIKKNKKDPEKNYFTINFEAAEEIARQIRLRNISGIIIIDFIDMEKQKHRDKLMGRLNELFIKDPIKTVLVDMTKLNLVEVTRKKIRKPLGEKIHQIKVSEKGEIH